MANDNSIKGAGIKINYGDLSKYRSKAELTIKGCEVVPSSQTISRIEEVFGDVIVFKINNGDRRKPESANLHQSMINLRDRFLPNCLTSSPNMALASYILQEAITMGHYMNEEQKKILNIDREEAKDEEGYDDKRMSAATIGIFSMASYAIFLLDNSPKLGGNDMSFGNGFQGIPELPINTFHGGLSYMAYFLDLYLRKKSYINSEKELLGFLRTYFMEVQKETAMRKDILKADAIFESNRYMMDVPDYNTPFCLDGWEVVTAKANKKTFRRLDPSKMVGNEEELALLMRLAFMICSYKPEIQQNVWNKFGNIQNFLAFYGKPGCGKTMLARILATLIYDLCVLIGREKNFNFLELDPTVKDKYVGETAKKVQAWLENLANLNNISFGLVDDAEALLQDMAEDKDGSKDVTSKFLNFTDGAGSTFQEIFNCILFVGTNNYEVFSPPIKSRFSISREIIGPKKASDFTSIAKFTLDKFKKYGGILTSSKNPEVGIQKVYHAQEVNYADISQLNLEKELDDIHRKVVAEGYTGEDLVGEVFARTKLICPSVSGRTMDNYMKAVTAVINAFPIPENASKDRTVFFDQPIEEQEKMINDWIKDHVAKIDYPAMVVYTMLKFLNDEIKTTKFADKKVIDKILEQDRIQKKAKKALDEQNNN